MNCLFCPSDLREQCAYRDFFYLMSSPSLTPFLRRILWLYTLALLYVFRSATTSSTQQGRRSRGAGGKGFRLPPLPHPRLSQMLQARFNHLAILNTHKERLEKLCLVSVASSFVSLNENRQNRQPSTLRLGTSQAEPY